MNGNAPLRLEHPTAIVAIASTFYTAALEEPFRVALADVQSSEIVACVPYNQLNTFLLKPSSVITDDVDAKVLVLLRVEDFIRLELGQHSKQHGLDSCDCLSVLRQHEAEFLEIIARMQQLRLTVMICPAGRGAYDSTFLSNAIRITEHKISARLKAQQKHLVVNWSEFETHAPAGKLFNPAGDRLGHVPFSPEGLSALAQFFTQKLDQIPTVTLSPKAMGEDTADFEYFLASLSVVVTVAPMTLESDEVSIGLMRHTTHFITHPADRTPPGRPLALASAASEGEAWKVVVEDRFGNYGVSGAVVFGFDTNVMRIMFLFLTCPVLGRQVEHAMFHWLADVAEHRNAEFIQIAVLPGRDNKVLSQLLQKVDAEAVHDNGTSTQRNEATQFTLCVADLKNAVMKVAPNPAALTTIIANMSKRETTNA
jgi:hypothetical protein